MFGLVWVLVVNVGNVNVFMGYWGKVVVEVIVVKVVGYLGC